MNAVALPAWCKHNHNVPFPKWLKGFQEQAQLAFQAQGLPNRKNESWKYSDVSFLQTKQFSCALDFETADPSILSAIAKHQMINSSAMLIVCINGQFAPSYSNLSALPKGAMIKSMQQAIAENESHIKHYFEQQLDVKKYPFAKLNLAQFLNGVFLYLPDHCQIDAPIQMLSIATQNEFVSHPHHLIVLGEHAKATVCEEYIAIGKQAHFLNSYSMIALGAEAQYQHYKVQHENINAVHIAFTQVEQKRNSKSYFLNISKGAQFARDDLVVKLAEMGADCQTSGFYCVEYDNQLVDHHVDIEHLAPQSRSSMFYKGTLDNQSQAVFNGRVHVAKGAQQIVAEQANHNLLLSDYAAVYAKPELEIYADDVKCQHGATTGQLDQDALFYLRSRGISAADATRILLQGFAAEIKQRILHPDIKQHLDHLV